MLQAGILFIVGLFLAVLVGFVLARRDVNLPPEYTNKVIAVDFDGCLCENKYPQIGKPNMKCIKKLLREQRNGAKIILWTCREGEALEDAMIFCWDFNIYLDAINESLPSWIESFNTNPRKIGATEYWDDKAVKVKY